LFSVYITQETGMHQTWVCTTKSAALEGPIVGTGAYMPVPHWSLFCREWSLFIWSLFGRHLVGNSLFARRNATKPSPHAFNSHVFYQQELP
jgi:hypothetical protein